MAYGTCLLLLVCWLGPSTAGAFDLADVEQRARALAQSDYRPPQDDLPGELRALDHAHYEQIHYRPEEAYWHNQGLPFELEFFHRGAQFVPSVQIFEVQDTQQRPMVYSPRQFEFGSSGVDPAHWGAIGYAGFRVHAPLNQAGIKDEVLVFLGASYFRALGHGQRYGLSARALAIDTALASGEEFPRFTSFWVVRPSAHAKSLVVFALLDSPSVAGAYRLELHPGVSTELEVHARLYFRHAVNKLGIAPLTSMYLFGSTHARDPNDYRPRVHDSDGLLVHDGRGEWIWRPLDNPARLAVTSFETTDPAGFGLMQRNRRFTDYEDIDDRYDLRPSAWVEPHGRLGHGRIELVELPVPDETNDNIVAYWVPQQSPAPGQPLDLSYRISWQMDEESHGPLGLVVATLRGDGSPQHQEGTSAFAIDFAGGPLARLTPGEQPEVSTWVDRNAQVVEQRIERNEALAGWRVVLHVRRNDVAKPVEMRVQLHRGAETLSETWSYLLPAQ